MKRSQELERVNADAIVQINKNSIASKILANAEEIELKKEELRRRTDHRALQ